MEHSFWDSRWKQHQIGFHLEEVNPKLVQHWEPFLEWLGDENEGAGRVLVPLAGKSRDMTWLAQRGHPVVGIEFVEQAAKEYFDERGVTPMVTRSPIGTRYAYDGTEVLVADFFAVDSAHTGPVRLAYDRAALVAIAPERRAAYVRKLASLLQPPSGLLLASFEHDIGSGPPHSVPEVAELFADAFEIERRDEEDVLESAPRFRERGATMMRQVIWYARRRT